MSLDQVPLSKVQQVHHSVFISSLSKGSKIKIPKQINSFQSANNNLCSHSELKTKHKNGLNFSNVMSAYFPLKKTIVESETEAFPVLTLHSNASLIYPQRSSLETDFTTATFFFITSLTIGRHRINDQYKEIKLNQIKKKIKINIALEEYAEIFR